MTMIRTMLVGALALAMLGAAQAQTPAETVAQATAKAPSQITLYDQDIPWPYEKIGVVRALYHQTAFYVKIPVEERLDMGLREEAAKLGADAIIQVRYDFNSPLSNKGNHAEGIAVRLLPQTAAASPTEAGPTEIGPTGTSPAVASPSPAPPRGPAVPGAIILTEQDLPAQRYVKLGEVRGSAYHTAFFMKTPIRTQLNNQLREQAAKLGANAVVLIKYELSSPMSKEPGTAVGVAVRFE